MQGGQGIYTVELYLRVRLAVSEGMTKRQAAKHFNISRDSVAKMVAYSTPPGYQRRSPIRRPKLDAFVSTIDHWLDEDLKVPRKQRHTAKRVFDRLRDECGFTGGYTIIKDYMRERDQRRQEVFVPLSHPPGHAQADFGEATVVIGGVEQKARFFVLDLPHSDGCYVRAYPAAVAEAWVDGHIHAFAFFGAVPRSIVYDNDRCLVAKILPDGTRKRAALFSGFLSHYLIRDRYGRPGKGNDKGNVEGLVGYARRNFMVPIPQFPTWDAFNAFLEEQCRKRQRDKLRGESETIGERLKRDLAALRKDYAEDTALGRRRTTIAEAAPTVEFSMDAMIEKAPVTVILSAKGWIRGASGHEALDKEFKFKEGDGPAFALHAQTTDKLLVASCLLMLAADNSIHGWTLWAAVVILCREILVSGLREYLAELRVSVPVSRIAKWKTTMQIFALGFLIVGPAGVHILTYTVETGLALLWLSAALTLYTGSDYFRAGLRHVIDE